jgi:hypothetical protein
MPFFIITVPLTAGAFLSAVQLIQFCVFGFSFSSSDFVVPMADEEVSKLIDLESDACVTAGIWLVIAVVAVVEGALPVDDIPPLGVLAPEHPATVRASASTTAEASSFRASQNVIVPLMFVPPFARPGPPQSSAGLVREYPSSLNP